MINALTYLLPRAHTSMTRSIGILLVIGMMGGVCIALADALPGLLQGLGWQDAPRNTVVVWAVEITKDVPTVAFLMCWASGAIAFAARAGLIQLPELEFQLALIREYLKDMLRIGRDAGDR
ncbi:MAG TPA: hypothetical protein VGF43_00270 [Dongiaceae bacterium]|jgi:ABC-type amino acid transport system permease subunit